MDLLTLAREDGLNVTYLTQVDATRFHSAKNPNLRDERGELSPLLTQSECGSFSF